MPKTDVRQDRCLHGDLKAAERMCGSALPPHPGRRLWGYGACFAVGGIQVSNVVLTCLRWHPSQPGVMNRLSEDPISVSNIMAVSSVL